MATSVLPPDDRSADDHGSDDRSADDRRLLAVLINRLPDLVQAAAPIIVALIIHPPSF